ncbi:Fe2+-dependent dioxygenase [Synechococcus sp. CCY9201]|uniref:Fe2+-dependent dioxygenase n=1 Tax=unclassified Synechococcus TaxID=2626047 RepID=UPI0018CDA7E3|nr:MULTISPECIES: Fe2+-dependent dioxygenase [unclassified Synechococcus]MEA5424562.1 Fe2+-dependent dioxygenase [Synechococcus sp. CCY9202]MEA5472778.1 Fe2+-dependent dioxygenase [Synechococcus sp. CCY9201]QPN59228.1 Fe2+-dependent dioxygenase [Synechococcus sp. CBW1002]QPN66019.1 Fe2+-dependent dioxygenase [Synechococcus sp. CBW1006]
MRFIVEPLFSPEATRALAEALRADDAPWRPGAETAGWHARGVKRNRQLERGSDLHHQLEAQVREALLADPLVRSAALPLHVHGVLFSLTGPGEGYGRHVDNAFMAGGRSDLSFTVALTDPAAYEGGDLVLESPDREERVRLGSGQAIVYPSTLLHRVEPVTAGERLVAVGWIQSRIRSSEQRELLFELDAARRALFQQQGKGEIFDLLCRSYTNLLRMWGE